MIPILYETTTTQFNTYGIGALADTLSCEVTEERNGAYECVMSYPITGALYSEIKKERIVKVKPNDTSSPQAFRIYRITTPINGTIKIYAQHISYDLTNIAVPPLSAQIMPPQLSMERVLNSALTPHNFTFQTDYTESKEFSVSKPKSVRAVIGGTEGSIINLWGGELEWDNFRIIHHQGRGHNNGVVIEYGKNLTKLEQDADNSDIYTDLLPYAVVKDQDANESVITLSEQIIPISETTLVQRKTLIKDFTDSFDIDTTITEELLRERAQKYLANNPLGIETPTITVSFEPLWKQAEYSAILERVSLCDTVTIKHTLLGISVKTKVVKTVYDALAEKYKTITLGSAKSNLLDTVNNAQAAAEQASKKVDRFPSLINTAIGNATERITGQHGGYVVLHGDNETGQPYELLILDAPTIEDAVNVWRWNSGGLAFSPNGYNGPYETAITADGSIVANFITSGSLVANIIKAGVLSSQDGSSYWNLETGEVVLRSYATTSKIETIEGSVSTLTGTVNGLSGSVSTLTDNVSSLSGTVGGLSDDVSGLSGDVSSLSGNVGTLTTNVNGLSGSVGTLQNNVTGLSGSVTTLSGNVTTLSGQVSGLSDDVSGLTDDVSGLSGDVSSLSGNVGTLQTSVNGLSGSVGTLQTNVNGLSGSVGTLQTNVNGLSGSVTTLSGNVSTLTGQVSGLSSDVSDLSGDVTSLSGNVGTLTTNVNGLQGNVTTLTGNVTTLSGQVSGLSDDVSGLSGDVSSLSDSVDSLSSDVDGLAGDVGTLSTNLGTLSGKVGTLTTNVTTLTTKQSNLETSVNGLSSSVTALTTRVTTAEGTLVSVTSDISNLQQTASDISATVSKKVDETCGTSSSSFGWSLKSTGFYVYSSANTVMSITSSGLSVVGAIDATSGSIGNLTIDGYLYFGGDTSYYISANYNDSNYYISLPGLRIDKASKAVFSGKLSTPSGTIGGFNIGTSSIYNGKTSYSSSASGVYLGTDGIGLGAGTFYVTSAGKLYATDAEISGVITATSGTIGGFTINSTSLSNTSGGSYIQIKSGNYVTELKANYVGCTYSTSEGIRGWTLSLNQISISSYTSSKFTGVKITPTYTKRSSYTSTSSTTVSEGCITSARDSSYNVDGGYYSVTATPFLLGICREYCKSPYMPSYEWASYLRFVDYNLSELVYDSYLGGTWRLRNVYTGTCYDIVSLLQHVNAHKFYFWTYTSSISDDAVVTCTQSTHGLSSVSGAILIPRSTVTSTSSLSGYNNIVNNGHHDYGITISGTTVYFCLDYGTFKNGFYCLIYGY